MAISEVFLSTSSTKLRDLDILGCFGPHSLWTNGKVIHNLILWLYLTNPNSMFSCDIQYRQSWMLKNICDCKSHIRQNWMLNLLSPLLRCCFWLGGVMGSFCPWLFENRWYTGGLPHTGVWLGEYIYKWLRNTVQPHSTFRWSGGASSLQAWSPRIEFCCRSLFFLKPDTFFYHLLGTRTYISHLMPAFTYLLFQHCTVCTVKQVATNVLQMAHLWQ